MTLIDMLTETFNRYAQAALETAPMVLVAMVLLALSWWLSRPAKRGAELLAGKFVEDKSVRRLAGTLVRMLVIVIGAFAAATVVFPGLDVGDLVGVLGLSSVAVGFAFKDIFQNFLAGLIILTQRPFKIGDQIEAPEVQGTVDDITIRSTVIRTFDGRRTILPNSALLTQAVTVNTTEPVRRTTFSTGIGYGEDIEQARDVISEALSTCALVLTTPAPEVHAVAHGDNAIQFDVRYWTRSDQATVNRAQDQVVTAVKYALDDNDIEIPFPQRSLHLESLPVPLIDAMDDYDGGDDRRSAEALH